MRLVSKPWGIEEIWAETDMYVGKFLYINPGARLSRQYHARKTETIRVIEGPLVLETINSDGVPEERLLNRGESFHVAPLTIHRFGARETAVILVEVSTPELDDVVRIQDDYKRR